MINEEFRTAISDPRFENVDSCDNTTKNKKPAATKASITKDNWGELAGKKVYLFTLTNNKGTEVTITNYGGTPEFRTF